MKTAVIQLKAGSNKEDNIRKAICLVKKAIDRKATFILLPEVFTFRGVIKNIDGYFEVAEHIPGTTLNSFTELARKNKVFILVGSVFEKIHKSKKVYNTSVLIDDKGKIAGKYRKINLFDAVLGNRKVQESLCFRSGNKKILTNVGEFKVGLTICYDLRFPELFKNYSQRGANVLVVPSAFTQKTGQAHWEVLLRARAIENLSYVLAPNQFGEDTRGIKCYGNSMIISPWGEVLARASGAREEIIYANLDKKYINEARKILPGIVV